MKSMVLTSQTSSSSLTSVLSPKNEKSTSDFPEKFKKCCVFSREVFLEDALTVIVTSEFELIECAQDKVTNYLNLKSKLSSDQINLNVDSAKVQFDVVILDAINKSVLYALRIDSVLFGIERTSSQLNLLEILTGVKTFKLETIGESNEPWLKVSFNDGTHKLTRFQDEGLEDFLQNKNSSQFEALFEAASTKTSAGLAELDKISRDIEKLDIAMYESSRTLPKLMMQDVSQSFENLLHVSLQHNMESKPFLTLRIQTSDRL